MFNREKHQLMMGRILRDMYADTTISSLFGFKGGTCAYFFYDLPRFSVDLDFDLLTQDKAYEKVVFEKVGEILKQYGEIKDNHIKHNTLFFLLSYGDTDHNIKIEISTRTDIPALSDYFELKEYLGISLLAGKKPYLFASKLSALTLRNEIAMRDIFDIWYFAKNSWDIDSNILKIRTGKSTKDHLTDCILLIEGIKDSQILRGLGELLDEKRKTWVKNNLKNETLFLLKNYRSVL